MQTGQISVERTDEVAVIAIIGEHDLNTAPALREQLDTSFAQGASVVVDLSGATFVDSSILGLLIDAQRRAHDRGLGFALMLDGGADSVRRVLDVTGLSSELPVHSSREEALEATRRGLGAG